MTLTAPLHAPSMPEIGRTATRLVDRRIVINGRFVSRPITGVDRYAGEIVRALDALISERHPSTHGLGIVLAVPARSSCDLPLKSIPVVGIGRWSGYAWEQIELPRFAGRSLILNLCNLAPVLLGRSMTCVHDAHAWLMPQNHSAAFRFAYRLLQPLALRRSLRWITVSRYSGERLLSFGVAKNRPDAVIPNGADHVLRWSAADAAIDRDRLPDRFVFALGSRSPNKNFTLVRRLAGPLAERGIAVVIAGGDNAKVFKADESGARARTIELGRVSDNDLAFLYSRARTFLFPSLHEGFGLPPVEAMLLGCPVVASNVSAMPEVLGDAAVLCDPADDSEWMNAVERICGDNAFRSSLIARGRERASLYTWRSSALAMLQLAAEIPAEASR